MRFISHRGNLYGSDPFLENRPRYIQEALNKGFDVEIDVRYFPKYNEWFLGHDKAQYKVSRDWLRSFKQFWIHAKNLEALVALQTDWRETDPPYFWHENDTVSVVSNGTLWTYPNKRLMSGWSIAVLPEKTDYKTEDMSECFGICSDYIVAMKANQS